MWAKKDNERSIGKGLLHLVFWMWFQTFVIAILDSFGVLPGDLLGMEPFPTGYYIVEKFYYDPYTLLCAYAGCIYTTIGCIILVRFEVNTRGWWQRVVLWYTIYLLVAFAAFYDLIGWRVVDVWSAPVLWMGEIELIYYLQKGIAQSRINNLINKYL